jgi:Amt family ammonium transporter
MTLQMSHTSPLRIGLMAAGALAAFAAPAIAQDAAAAPEFASAAETAFIFNTLLFLIGGFLVMFMAAGFAMLEAGLVRSKNVSMQCLKNIALYSIAGIMFWVIGYSLMYTGVTAAIIGTFALQLGCWRWRRCAKLAILGYCLRLVLPDGVLRHHRIDRVRHAGRAHQAVAVPDLHRHPDRCSLPDHRLLEVGRRLARRHGLPGLRRLDHRALGWRLGRSYRCHHPRCSQAGKYGGGKVNPMPGSNIPLATLGTFILWLGWFGFNGASQLAMGSVWATSPTYQPHLRQHQPGCLPAAWLQR